MSQTATNVYIQTSHRGFPITVEGFRQGFNVSWEQGGKPYLSIAWPSSRAALNHAKKQIDKFLKDTQPPRA